MYEVYQTDDLILPSLELPDPCEVRLEIKDERVTLVVGQRDWCWNRTTGKMIGAGTMLCKPMADDGPPTTIPEM